MLFGEMALKLKFVTVDEVEECLRHQSDLEERGIDKSLGAIMHDKGYLDMLQVRAVLDALDRPMEVRRSVPGYRVVRVLGKGTMGTVYQGERLSDGTLVAIKVLSPSLAENPTYLKRFLREVEVAREVEHPSIVKFHETGEKAGYHFLIMEFIDGYSLDVLLDRGPLPEATALHVGLGISRALAHIDEKGLIHRDIKPGNVIVGSDGLPRLCDLGLTKYVAADDGDGITRRGTILGTPYYISPEQATAREDIDIRSDIYSLGATLYHAVVGEPPFPGRTPREILDGVMKGPLRSPRTTRPDLSRGTDALIRCLMARDREKRPADPTEVVELVEEVSRTGQLGSPMSRLKGWLGLE